MDLEGPNTKGSQSGRGRLWYMRQVPSKTNINIQGNIFTIPKGTLRIQSQTECSGKKKKVKGLE